MRRGKSYLGKGLGLTSLA